MAYIEREVPAVMDRYLEQRAGRTGRKDQAE
jgi:hypothetical protein